ncbi:uncharacterized protein Tco025E_00408 [Trypanosoma conorhini]|uniref:Uncharacterized protein n=1 Tax=Trypanosoma conorhini TaxID=83891 RepID=A0A422QBJ7_9TRYP|nr:uncharacterized protein Tco025E_00408 [Trypanosoma conorhini]RNF27338.1 hypothetical protein Tco025E_00408 [Trypanosoma conorhini]
MSSNPKCGREALRVRFSDAAKSVSELYRTAVLSYDAGHRDALLCVHRYILLTTPGLAASSAALPHSGQSPVGAVGSSAPPPSLDAERLLRFVQNSLRRHEVVAVASRGTRRRRKRSSSCVGRPACGGQPEGEGGDTPEDAHGAPRRRVASPGRAVEEPGAEVGDMLRDVRISHPVESESGTDDDDDLSAEA